MPLVQTQNTDVDVSEGNTEESESDSFPDTEIESSIIYLWFDSSLAKLQIQIRKKE